LYIHCIESKSIAEDEHGGEKAPDALLPQGVNLRMRLHLAHVSAKYFTLDDLIHSPSRVASFKRMADVCLHPRLIFNLLNNFI